MDTAATPAFREETDAIGPIDVEADKLWGAETQRSLEYFSTGADSTSRDLIAAFAILKKAAANANLAGGRLSAANNQLIATVCDEILAGRHADMFPLHVGMTGSGTLFNMNVNEVISNRACQLAGTRLGSKTPIHPAGDANMSQSPNETFPSAMGIAAVLGVTRGLAPALTALRDAIAAWQDTIEAGNTQSQDAVPLTPGQPWTGYASMLDDDLARLQGALDGVCRLALGGTRLDAASGFGAAVAAEVAKLTGQPFVSATSQFPVQGAQDDMVQLSAAFRVLAASLYTIAKHVRLIASSPRARVAELAIPANPPGPAVMPAEIDPAQCEALAMTAIQVMANDVAIAFASAHGETNAYQTVISYHAMHSLRILTDGCSNFCTFLIAGAAPDLEKIKSDPARLPMRVAELARVIGCDNFAAINDMTLKAPALRLNMVTGNEFDRIADPAKMLHPYIAPKT